MAKINILAISSDLKDLLDSLEFNLKIEESRKKSSDAFDNSNALVIEEFCPLFILIAICYYELESSNSELDIETIENIDKLVKVKKENFISAEPSNYEETIAIDLLKKFNRLEISKGKFELFNFVIFDDNSREHLAAFGVKSISKIPVRNILLKFTINGVHLRCGISKKANEFKIIDIVSKATGNN